MNARDIGRKSFSLERQIRGQRLHIEGLADEIGVELVENDPEARIQTGAEPIVGGSLSWYAKCLRLLCAYREKRMRSTGKGADGDRPLLATIRSLAYASLTQGAG